MPSVILSCEFCHNNVRKDRYGQHVKVKHNEELCRRFLEDATAPMFNPIQSFNRGTAAKNIPIYSRNEEGAVWYFGVHPKYFRQHESYADYLTEENMAEHKRYLEDVLRGINIVDYVQRVGRGGLKSMMPCSGSPA